MWPTLTGRPSGPSVVITSGNVASRALPSSTAMYSFMTCSTRSRVAAADRDGADVECAFGIGHGFARDFSFAEDFSRSRAADRVDHCPAALCLRRHDGVAEFERARDAAERGVPASRMKPRTGLRQLAMKPPDMSAALRRIGEILAVAPRATSSM